MKTQDLSIHIVEDDLSFNKLIGIFLRNLGFSNIKSYNSGKSYLESNAYNEKPDIVLVDYHLDDNLTGSDVLKKIKSNSKASEVVMMSAFFTETEIFTKERFKPYAFISKSDNFTPKLKKTLQSIQLQYEQKYEQRNIRLGISLFLIIGFSIITYFITLN